MHNNSASSWVGIVVSVAYFVYCWSTTGQTLGDKIVGVRVVTTDGSRLSIGGAFVRYLGMVISSIPLFLGLLWVLWDPQHQGWHDKMASTQVVRA